jgi:3-hydroxyisobutyrate dehydrogenase-like beta-hydroxyacid dehydrogenase
MPPKTPDIDKSITIVGLGLMGTAIAKRFLAQGWNVFVWNRTHDKSDPLRALGAQWTDLPFATSSVCLVSLYNSDAVKEVFANAQAYAWTTQWIIDTTTGSPDEVAPLAHLAHEKGVAYLDAPISGSSQQTLDGEATVIVGGAASDFIACDAVWKCLTNKVYHTGNVGTASKLKLVSNLILGLNRLALAEGLAYAESLGLPLQQTLDILKASAAYSKVMDVKGRKMLQRDYSVQARLHQHLKDVHIILASAASHGQSLPTTTLHEELLSRAVSQGLADYDNCAILEVLRGKSP